MSRVLLSLVLVVALASADLTASTIEIDLTAGYQQDVWFNLENREVVHNEDKDNWDIAFQTGGINGGIRINGQKGLKVWLVPGSNGESWSEPVDTTGMAATWDSFLNSTSSWSIGAFNMGKNGTTDPNMSFGWGSYNMTSHFITGEAVFVIKVNETTYKKFFVESLVGGKYDCYISDLDGSNEINFIADKNNFENQNYFYYSIENNEFLSREPNTGNWHLVFGKYQTLYEIPGGGTMPYGVTGVRTNSNIMTAELNGVNPMEVSAPKPESSQYSSEIDVIGYDWKKPNATAGYDIIDDKVFFLTSSEVSIAIYRLYFKSFEQTTGKLSFELTEVTTSVIEGNNDYSGKFTVYPNVISSNDNVNISMDLPNHGDFKISIVDMLGQSIVTKNLSAVNSFDTYTLQNLNLSKGMYFVTITTANGTGSQKLIVE